MRIKEFCEKTGLSRDTVRFYEKRGLLHPKVKGLSNQYRDYTEDELEVARMVKMGQAMGFTLSEMGEELKAWRGGRMTVARKLKLIDQKREAILAKIEEFRQMEEYLRKKGEWIREGKEGLPPGWSDMQKRRGK